MEGVLFGCSKWADCKCESGGCGPGCACGCGGGRACHCAGKACSCGDACVCGSVTVDELKAFAGQMCGAAECPCCDQSDCNCGPSCGCGKGLPRKTKEQWLQSYARYAGKAPAMCGSCKCREGGKCACRSTGKCH